MDISSSVLLLSFKSLLLAAALGALIGMEREWARKEAGTRTFSMISLGAALFVIVSHLSFGQYLSVSSLDPSRTLGQIIVGIGFLGAGIIIFRTQDGIVRNLTTAAMMWVTAAIGATVGLGLYWLAIFTTFLVLFINIVVLPIEKKVEDKIDKMQENKK